MYSTDATPFNCCEGWLEKRSDDGVVMSGSWQAAKWFQTNNEYLNYYEDQATTTDPLGSYSLKKMESVAIDQESPRRFVLRFKDGVGVPLVCRAVLSFLKTKALIISLAA